MPADGSRPGGPAGGRRFGGLLWHRGFRLLWIGETVSQLGNAIALVGVLGCALWQACTQPATPPRVQREAAPARRAG